MIETKPSLSQKNKPNTPDPGYKEQVLNDYRTCCVSREASLIARKEVLTGKAKFGIIGDGKEVAQVALSRVFRKGDWRSGYYRDQTIMFALGLSTVEQFFAQLYADTEHDPFSKGRQMNCHFANATIDPEGNWVDHTTQYNISADLSPTAGQMARALGLALASKKYRDMPGLQHMTSFSRKGDEIVFCTIGDASTSEGVFWETINAAGVLKVPLIISIWDDGYGISVPSKYQTTKGNISEVLEGFRLNEQGEGLDIYVGYGWDYRGLREIYEKAAEKTRQTHIPAIVHVRECTQPQGHSTSGSHERYKSKERLAWEAEMDGIKKMGEWIVQSGMASAEELEKIQEESLQIARAAKSNAWKSFVEPVNHAFKELNVFVEHLKSKHAGNEKISALQSELNHLYNPTYHDVVKLGRRLHNAIRHLPEGEKQELEQWLDRVKQQSKAKYDTHLYSVSKNAALKVPVVSPKYSEDSPVKNGYEVLNTFFDKALGKYPEFFAFGEDVGHIGGVNQSFMGMQTKYGEDKVFDTGIREWTIMGQAIGMAMRGLRPLGEIQYLDYLLYGLEPLSDDVATLRWRTAGQQKAPIIVRTRGHRLEGIWHAGSPMGLIVNSLRGMYVCVPRNTTQAAGMYNTLLQGDDPALVIECLNGYRLKEILPDNIGEYTVPLGKAEILRDGTDVTLVTYGSCVRIAEEGINMLAEAGISVELVDAQTLLPFDLGQTVVKSLRKTNRIVFMDEDLPGGATAYMMQKVLEEQGGYRYLDSEPRTLTAAEHRPPYGSDGDYFSKPNAEDVFDVVYALMQEVMPGRYP